jgi:hypothetical protein
MQRRVDDIIKHLLRLVLQTLKCIFVFCFTGLKSSTMIRWNLFMAFVLCAQIKLQLLPAEQSRYALQLRDVTEMHA